MKPLPEHRLSITWRYLTPAQQSLLRAASGAEVDASLRQWRRQGQVEPFVPELAQLERLLAVWRPVAQWPTAVTQVQLNPTLQLVELSWSGLLSLCAGEQVQPQPQAQHLALWQQPDSDERCCRILRDDELLALKIVAERHDRRRLAAHYQRPVGVLDRAVERAGHSGLLLMPPSTLCRSEMPVEQRYRQARVFTLQWHITHRCDLHCRHCYDRSQRHDVSLQQGLDVLDQLRDFCLRHHVAGQVSFSGGNPLLHPDFFELYQAAVDRNLTVAILGNATDEATLERLSAIAKPAFYQVSLEGLAPHNDLIRGAGNFSRVLDFLALLKRKNIYSMVMLTLTRGNLDQVIALGERLRDQVDLFTYNRLSMVGEGAQLASPRADEYQTFARDYLLARQHNPTLALKDSLLNIERQHSPQGVFGGCTGFGCGAAFNFVSLLPDGQVHACRKFPSLIGDLTEQTLTDIYESAAARAYRRGCVECDPCPVRPVCGGCLAVAYGWGLDPLRQRDPACFMELPG